MKVLTYMTVVRKNLYKKLCMRQTDPLLYPVKYKHLLVMSSVDTDIGRS